MNVIEKRDEDFEEEVELRTMKEHIDLEWQSRKHSGRDFKDIAGSFWVAASVFSRKVRKWRRKQKMKNRGRDPNSGGGRGGGGLVAMEVEKVNGRHMRETQSEIGDYGFGRRSCDTDPRFSVDANRVSLDYPRYSFDESRASWDGCLIGRTLPRLTPNVSVCRNDNRLSVEGKMNSKNEDDSSSPGGSAQTRDYYSDSSSRRRRSFDQSSSGRKGAVVEVDEMKSISNAKVSPTTIELFHGAKVLITERDLRDSNLKDDRSESLDSASKDAASVAGGGGHRKGFKKYHRWRKPWTIWGLIHKRSERKYEDLVDGSPAESWLKPGREANGEAKEGFPDKVIRSNSSGSSKNSSNLAGSFRSMTSSAEIKGHGKKKREHLGPERNRSARYSPNNLDNGLLRFYLTPLRSSRSKCGKSRLKNSHSISRGVLRLY
ncbi:hypothetical protein L1049_013301 [Liquidambar formosana]|uniref:Uncharacterized protein n=1 Tax=Liquidambar formosana TaxID=63359 RepID=A0AAP0WU58_LIQFO